MATLIGRVGMVIKGAWDSSVAYDTLDVVTYNNNTYIAKQASPAGTLPTNTTYWQLSLDASLLATKVSGATSGNFAGLDANGNLVDSGKKPSDFLPVLIEVSQNAEIEAVAAYSIGTFTLYLNVPNNYIVVGVLKIVPGNTGLTIASYTINGPAVSINVYNARDVARNAAPEITVRCMKIS